MQDLMQACEEPGTWHMMEDMKPAAYGEYTVIRRRPGKKMDLDEMLWNGAYWVTRKGSVSVAVVAWFEEGTTSSGAAAPPSPKGEGRVVTQSTT